MEYVKDVEWGLFSSLINRKKYDVYRNIYVYIAIVVSSDHHIMTALESKLQVKTIFDSDINIREGKKYYGIHNISTGKIVEINVDKIYNKIIKDISNKKSLQVSQISQMIMFDINSEYFDVTMKERLLESNSTSEISTMLLLYKNGLYYGVFDANKTKEQMLDRLNKLEGNFKL